MGRPIEFDNRSLVAEIFNASCNAGEIRAFIFPKYIIFVLCKDGIPYFIILRSDGFWWSPWHVDNHSVLLVLDDPFG